MPYLGFDLVEDVEPDEIKRWVVVRPPASDNAGLPLARADNERQIAAIDNQTGGRVGFFLKTDDFDRVHRVFTAHGVKFGEEPRREAYGTVAVFSDPFGNRWDLIEPA